MNDQIGKHPELVRWTAYPPSGGDPAEAFSAIQEIAAPDYAFTDTVVSFSGDSATTAEQVHRVRDYFESIEIDHECVHDRRAYELEFHPRMEANGFWKDAMLSIVRALKEKGFEMVLTSVKRPGRGSHKTMSGGT
ncbi:MAG TPA: hypothetical protein VFC78_12170 [Tepidisphaeraceae bacterium]|nr:hypothetical protein [Tepidisphaeraceae bacterium]